MWATLFAKYEGLKIGEKKKLVGKAVPLPHRTITHNWGGVSEHHGQENREQTRGVRVGSSAVELGSDG